MIKKKLAKIYHIIAHSDIFFIFFKDHLDYYMLYGVEILLKNVLLNWILTNDN